MHITTQLEPGEIVLMKTNPDLAMPEMLKLYFFSFFSFFNSKRLVFKYPSILIFFLKEKSLNVLESKTPFFVQPKACMFFYCL